MNSVRDRLQVLMGGRRASPPATKGSAVRGFLDQNRLVGMFIFLVTVVAIVIISSAGISTINLPVQPGQVATMRVVAGASFDYQSEERTRSSREQVVSRVPPVYRLDFQPFVDFQNAAHNLLAKLEVFEAVHRSGSVNFTGREAELTALADEFNLGSPFHVTPEDAAALLSIGDAAARSAVFENGLGALRDIYNEGVHDASFSGSEANGVAVFQVARPAGGVIPRPVQSMEDALTFLRVSLEADGVPQPAAQALFRFFRGGVTANLVYDEAATRARVAAAAKEVRPAVVHVERGQVIIEAGERVTPEQYEMFRALQEYLRTNASAEHNQGLMLFGHVLLVLAMVLASMLYIRLEDPETLRSNLRLGLLALVVIGNLALVRMIYSLGGAEFFLSDSSLASTLPYVAPTALAPLIVAILIDAGSGIFMALLISIFTGVIYGNRLDLLVLTFLASMVAIFFCRDARRRGRVVYAGGAGGLTIAAFAALVGIANQTPTDTLVREMAAGLVTGLLTGVAVVGLLPVLESFFKHTTDITLLELTDYNHPLLRRMQLEAPGTLHHSLVVAQLSENACNAIGANPLLARVCALFHDIGKTANPGYFTENQRDRANPHDEKDPAVSARIVKQHVPDGVELAYKHRLPRAVIDVIRQHHGTTLVRFFYQRAVTASRPAFPEATPAPVPQSDYRYDGPKPQFKESAVISLADAVEAASRSLRSASPEQLDQIINRIISDRISDGQLDEAPLTFEDIAKTKNSFTFTLLNMLHARVAYDPGDGAQPGSSGDKSRSGI
jgi:putative nucleotidyltransferase with HDIG domain